MPLRMLYVMVLENDIKIGNAASETVGLLQQKEFYQVPYLWTTIGGFPNMGYCSDRTGGIYPHLG